MILSNSLYCQNFYDLIAKNNHKIGKNDDSPTFFCWSNFPKLLNEARHIFGGIFFSQESAENKD